MLTCREHLADWTPMENFRRIERQKGESLIALMVGLTVGLIVLTGAISLYAASIKSNNEMVLLSRLNLELKAIMDVIVRDVKRAQYNGDAYKCVGGSSCTNSFATSADDWSVSSNSIVYSYDLDHDGTRSQTECHGFRRVVSNSVGQVEMKTDCAPTWEVISSPNATNITNLAFSEGIQCAPSPVTGGGFALIREVKVYIEGSNGTNTRRFCQKIRIKNDVVQASCSPQAISTSAPFDLCPN